MAFQSNAFQNDAFQTTGDAVCTPAFNPTAFQNNAFQVCPETGECVPAFQLGAFLSAAFQVCEEAPAPTTGPVGGAWIEPKQLERARRKAEKRKKEIWRSIENTIEDAYADAKGLPRKIVRPQVREALADRSVARVEAIAAQLARANDPAAERLIEQIAARLGELQALALVYQRMEQQARWLAWRQNEDAIAVLLMVN